MSLQKLNLSFHICQSPFNLIHKTMYLMNRYNFDFYMKQIIALHYLLQHSTTVAKPDTITVSASTR